MTLLIEDSDDATGAAFPVPAPGHLYKSHLRTLYVWGTFDSANVALEITHDGSEWFPVPNADTITVKTVINVEFRAKQVRVVISGSTTLASISAFLY